MKKLLVLVCFALVVGVLVLNFGGQKQAEQLPPIGSVTYFAQ